MTDTIAPVAGKRYITRSGWITPVMKPHERGVQCRWIGSLMPSSKIWWGEDGRNLATLIGNESFDLVAEYIEPIPHQPDNTPDADGWIKWNGGECPVLPPDARIDIKLRGPLTSCHVFWAEPLRFRWSWHGDELDIVAYRISKDAATSAPAPKPKRVWLMDGKAYLSRRAAMATFLSDFGDETPVTLSVMSDAGIEKAFAANSQAPVITEMVEVTK